MRGRWVVAAILVVGVALALVAALARGRGRPRLPLRPGPLVLLTIERESDDPSPPPLGPFSEEAIRFPNAHAVTSGALARLGALLTGRLPRESGLVREGDAIRREIPLLGEMLGEAGFDAALFVHARDGFERAGLARGATPVVVDEAGGAQATVDRALAWLRSRGDAPSFCHVHLGRGGEEACLAFVEALAAPPIRDRVVIAAVAFGPGRLARASLRLPPGLLQAGEDAREVSTLDLAPSLLEVFGVSARPWLEEPNLIDARRAARRLLLDVEPMAAPLEECDEVSLVAGPLEYIVPPGHVRARLSAGARVVDDPALDAELRSLLEKTFGYRVEEAAVPEAADGSRRLVARYVGRAKSR